MSNHQGKEIFAYDYDAWGTLMGDEVTEPYNRKLFAGREFDFETGLAHMDARAYDSRTGSWLAACMNAGKNVKPVKYGDASQAIHAMLDVAGMFPGLGIVPDGVNVLYYSAEYAAGRAKASDAWLSALAMVPILGQGAALAKLSAKVGTKSYSVYRSSDAATGNVNYVGITSNFRRRAVEHLREKGIQVGEIPDLTKLSRLDAQSAEQALIKVYGLGKNGGSLMNKISSIAKNNPKYANAVNRGFELLKQIGYFD